MNEPQSEMQKLRARKPELWALYGADMMRELNACAKQLHTSGERDDEHVQSSMEAAVAKCTSALVERGNVSVSFTPVCTPAGQDYGTVVFYHEQPVYGTQERGTCCAHLGVVHVGELAADIWYCPVSETFHARGISGHVAVPRRDVRHVENPLGFMLRAAERLIQKRPELLAQPGENGYVN